MHATEGTFNDTDFDWREINFHGKIITYIHLNTCLMSILRFSVRDKVTLRLLKLYFNIVDVAERSWVLQQKANR